MCLCSLLHKIYLLAVLAAGEGRVFQSPNYPSNYPNLQACTYNFEPAAGAQLRFSCSDFDLTATSAAGALCTGDYLRYRRPLLELSTNLREVSEKALNKSLSLCLLALLQFGP